MLPESAQEFLNLANAHVVAPGGGPQHRFAAAQLARIAARCMDWTDYAGREAAGRFLKAQLTSDPRSGAAARRAAVTLQCSVSYLDCGLWRCLPLPRCHATQESGGAFLRRVLFSNWNLNASTKCH